MRAGNLVFDGAGDAVTESAFRDIYGRSLTADDVLEPTVA
jgi:phosphonate transport system ATP-binding protein